MSGDRLKHADELASGPQARQHDDSRDAVAARHGQGPVRSPRLGRMLLMIFPTATTRNSCPVTASSTANVCPGLASADHPWFVILRMYLPQPAVIQAKWECPGITKVG
jgi:hypothetical protein